MHNRLWIATVFCSVLVARIACADVIIGPFSSLTRDDLLWGSPDSWVGFSLSGPAAHIGTRTVTWEREFGFAAQTNPRPGVAWSGNFDGSGQRLLEYVPDSDEWILGGRSGTGIAFQSVGNSSGLGHKINDGRPFWPGSFQGNSRTQLMMYYPGRGDWSLATITGGQMIWKAAGNTMGAPTSPVSTVCQPQVNAVDSIQAHIASLQIELQHAAGNQKAGITAQIKDANEDLASANLKLSTCTAANPPPKPWPNLGQIWDGRPVWIGKFSQSSKDNVLFYTPGDHNWWLGSLQDDTLEWTMVGNTAAFGDLTDNRKFWIGDFNGDGKSEVLFYYPGDGNWWLGSLHGVSLTWTKVGNTTGFGNLNDQRPFWQGRFDLNTKSDQLLFYFPGDHNWWLGRMSGGQINWSLAGNFVKDDLIFSGDFDGNGSTDLIGAEGVSSPLDDNATWRLFTLNSNLQFVGADVRTPPPPAPPTSPPAKVAVPNIIGLAGDVAIKRISDAKLKVSAVNKPPGDVLMQDKLFTVTFQSPSAGSVVDEGSFVGLTEVLTTPPVTGVKAYQVFNCSALQRSVSIWKVSAAGQSHEEGTIAFDANNACGSSPNSLTVQFENGGVFNVIAVDKQLINCDGDDPNNVNCQRMIWKGIVGNSSGPSQVVSVP